MRISLKILVLIGGILMTGMVGGCDSKDQAGVEQSFEKVLDMYPTKDLTAFYDMEGYRDSDFDEEDKGTWVLQTRMSIRENEEDPVTSRGMVLRMNRNTRTSEGYYYVKETKLPHRQEDRYPITYDQEGFSLTEEISDPEVQEAVKRFQFFVQYGEFNNLKQYENLRKMYNPEVPLYELEYQLTNENKNVQELRERYDIPTEKAPTLLLSGRGDLDGSVNGYKRTQFVFDQDLVITLSDMIDYQPSKEADDK